MVALLLYNSEKIKNYNTFAKLVFVFFNVTKPTTVG